MWVHGSIVTGQLNVVSGAFGFIGSGRENTITGDCSAILGGSGNVTNHDWAGIFGCNLSSAAPKTFHANCFNGIDTPPAGSPYPAGTYVHWVATGGAIPAGCLVLMMC